MTQHLPSRCTCTLCVCVCMCVPRQPAWMETWGEWFPVKKDVSMSMPWIRPGTPNWMMHQS